MIRIEIAKTITNSRYVGKIIHNKPLLIFSTTITTTTILIYLQSYLFIIFRLVRRHYQERSYLNE
jgi:hypothetical protein